MEGDTNLRVLRPSRRKPNPGDIFAAQLPDGDYIFGRVILADLPRERAPMPNANLIYVYRERATSKAPNVEQLTPDRLLMPPLFTNRLAWTKGYFETVKSDHLVTSDLLPQHCFLRWTGQYLDETGEELPGPIEPCGDWSLVSYRAIDDQISDALGIPRAPNGE